MGKSKLGKKIINRRKNKDRRQDVVKTKLEVRKPRIEPINSDSVINYTNDVKISQDDLDIFKAIEKSIKSKKVNLSQKIKEVANFKIQENPARDPQVIAVYTK